MIIVIALILLLLIIYSSIDVITTDTLPDDYQVLLNKTVINLNDYLFKKMIIKCSCCEVIRKLIASLIVQNIFSFVITDFLYSSFFDN